MDILAQSLSVAPTKHLPDLLLLGDPRLYERCEAVTEAYLPLLPQIAADLRQVMAEVREKYRFGRGIAAPQLGYMKRVIYLDTDRPRLLINPDLTERSADMFELWDDCMCFPHLLVRVQRHRRVTVNYLDENWEQKSRTVEDDLSELIQHEYDHLEGVLCTMRAVDEKAFRWRG
ncbi:MAG: peptide deformylase [Haliscomenobacteraceae bacterium CHB4]|nr:Peptide deformylase [Saprospiraceae bacterium]MCE7926047.1 peptide deformylase [Haliscomenobacteraceae bacterium CHB4]